MEQCLGGGLLSLSLVSFLFAIYFFNFLNLFARLVILSVAKNPKNLRYALFMDTSLALSMTNSGFCLKMTDKENALCHLATINKSHNFTHQKHFFAQILGAKFTNFTRFFGLPRSLCSLAMTARQKFKFFTQNSRLFTNSNHLINSRHFINSTHFVNSKHFTNSIHFINFIQNSKHFVNPTHFITLSQISSHTQGFFIFLPQVFAQFLLINSLQRSSYGRQDTKAPF